MAILRETVHHALGTFARGAELPDNHPLVVAAPDLFDAIGTATVDRSTYTATAKPGRPRKQQPAE